jgi:L-cysteine S-thiosulfotransferase
MIRCVLHLTVVAGLVPAICTSAGGATDDRDKPGHDERGRVGALFPARTALAAALTLLAPIASAAEKHSGYDDASPETRAMQDDDAGNPGFLWVQQGETLWSERPIGSGPSCAECHGVAPATMRGVAARYPRYNASLRRPVTLAQQIQQCRTERQGAPPLPPESDALLGLTAYVGLQSRGMPLAVEIDGPAWPFFEAGKALFTARQGQLNLSCSQCHDGLTGQRLGGSVIPQGHPNGYPEYRLEWQAMGSLDRRIRNCMVGVRAGLRRADRHRSLSWLAVERAHGGDAGGSALNAGHDVGAAAARSCTPCHIILPATYRMTASPT